MYLYVGKLNWSPYADNECITMVFPAGFALKDPVCAYWQWTIDGAGVRNKNCTQEGLITSVSNTTKEYRVRIPFYSYAFEGTVSTDFSSLSLEMMNSAGDKSSVNLSLNYSNGVRVPCASVFTGKLNWFESLKNEMATLTIPGELENDEPVILTHQWTLDSFGKPKKNSIVNGKLRSVKSGSNDTITAQFDNGYYTYKLTIPSSRDQVVLQMTNPSGDVDSSGPHTLSQTDFRNLGNKKALIVRYGTGTDDGIFRVRDMLVKHLGFAHADVELSYFDVDPDKGPKKCTLGQDPPTVENFKSKFIQLCAGAVAGDVRCLYVDAHGTTYPDEDGSGEKDGNDEGWVMASNNNGTSKAILDDDWLAKAIRANLKKGVNLTIITSSCMGGGMLDTHTATPGVLLAGCHETQFNVKALNRMDPWIFAITAVIKKNVEKERGVPTYSVLYNAAKNSIRKQIKSGGIGSEGKYKGPSPKEWEPVARDQATNTSYQDPQLIFYDKYFDPSEEKFLSPFVAPNAGHAGGDVTRFPEDEYPQNFKDEL
ncbi:hypothetical protein ONZ43_g1515 [Nemania bipapillata]|uniref:Uncharacterized protein n=1 Tax=Nemania bipapillata TaxID=110536 RepID=A0ACC2J417_9PEZI|nr:hypothetical protein ONZ43_g1515 [Nemania bipapillata]